MEQRGKKKESMQCGGGEKCFFLCKSLDYEMFTPARQPVVCRAQTPSQTARKRRRKGGDDEEGEHKHTHTHTRTPLRKRRGGEISE